jgi:hypothetical protein
MAGKNAGGAMVVHTDDAINYTFFAPPDYCAIFPYAGDDCRELNPVSTYVDPNGLLGALVYYVAAFPPGAAPGVTVVYFGHDHNFGVGFIAGWNFCGPPNSLEVPDSGWPNNTSAGNSVAFGSAIAGDLVFPFYWLGVYGDVGNYIGPRINPTGGYAAFVSDDNPGIQDDCFLFGTMGWGEGQNDCPTPPEPEACCFEDGTCELLLPGECDQAGGVFYGGPCDPNPCPPPMWACCFEDGSCVMLDEQTCLGQGGILWLPGVICDPNPCPPPPAVCCYDNGDCAVLIEEDCIASGGTFRPDLGQSCDPNPCPPPPPMGACCLADGSCVETLEADCGGDLWIPEEVCDPNPCPPVATEDATWGQIKSSYK